MNWGVCLLKQQHFSLRLPSKFWTDELWSQMCKIRSLTSKTRILCFKISWPNGFVFFSNNWMVLSTVQKLYHHAHLLCFKKNKISFGWLGTSLFVNNFSIITFCTIFGCFGNWMYSELLNNYLHSVKVFSLQQKICQKCNSVNLERARGVSIPSNWLKFFN